MSDSFDPYRVWLGIPPESRPPTHYELLGISPKEHEQAVIEAAVLRQSGYVRNFQIGKFAKDAARILNEIAAAKACLLDPAKRAKYDADLKARLPTVAESSPQTVTVPSPPAIDLAQLTGPTAELPHRAVGATARSRPRRLATSSGKRKPAAFPWHVVVGIAATLAAAGLAFILLRPRGSENLTAEVPTGTSRAPGAIEGDGSSNHVAAASEPAALQGNVVPANPQPPEVLEDKPAPVDEAAPDPDARRPDEEMESENRARAAAVVAVAPTSQESPNDWRYSTVQPADGWTAIEFDDSSWSVSAAGFGTKGWPNVRTEWKTPDIWLRRTFEVRGAAAGEALLNYPHLVVYSDDGAEIYINGILAASVPTAFGYVMLPIRKEARAALRQGKNVLAVHCKETSGGLGQYIDVGLVDRPWLKDVLPVAVEALGNWRYTTIQPRDGWQTGGFDDSSWTLAPAGFGSGFKPPHAIRTEWKTSDIWLRRSFDLEAGEGGAVLLNDPHLMVNHDDDAEVYVNGVLAAILPGWGGGGYIVVPISREARSSLRSHENLLAVHCKSTGGAQYIDVGLVDIRQFAPAEASFHERKAANSTVNDAANNLLGHAIAWYRAEGNADDSAGKHHGKLHGGVAFKPTKFGQAFEFDGKDGSVVVRDAPELNPSKQFTVMGWVCPSAGKGCEVIISKIDATLGPRATGYQYGLGPNHSSIVVQFNAPGEPWGANSFGISLAKPIANGEWRHVAASFDGQNLYAYDNASLIGSMPVGRKTVAPSRANFRIGNGDGQAGCCFPGAIVDAALFDRALSQAEVETVYRGTLDGKAGANDILSDAVAWYRAEGNADDSAHGHHGELKAAAAVVPCGDGHAFDFDGNGAAVLVPDAPDLNPSSQFTMMAWICPRVVGRSDSVIISKIGKESGDVGYEFGLSPDNASLFVSFDAPGEARRSNTLVWLPRPLAAGEWAHVAGTYYGDTLRSYLNGTEISAFKCGAKTVAPSPANFRISGDDDGNSCFNGLIDDAAFFDRALSQSEIQTIYRGTFGTLRGDDMGDFVRLRSGGGLQTPIEYAGPIDVSFAARTNRQNIRLSYGRAEVIWNWEVDPKQLHISRLDGTASTVPVTPRDADRWYAFRYIITPQGTRILVDDAVVFEESRSNAFFPPSQVNVHTAFDSIIDVKDFAVKPIEWLTPAQDEIVARYTNAGTIDVLALIDPTRDNRSGQWTKDFEGLHSPRDSVNAALRLPVAVPEEYCLTIVAERAKGWKGNPASTVGLLGLASQFNSVIDWNEASGLEQMEGKSAIDNESTTHCGTLFRDGKPSVVTYIVRRSGVEMLFDDRQILDWRGDFARLRTGWGPYLNAPLRLFLGTHCDWHFKAIRLTPLTDDNIAPPAANPPATDLLKTIDLRQHARGKWSLDGPTLVSPPGTSHAGVRFPGVVPDEYRLRILAERPRGFQGPPQFHLGLVTRSSQATLVLDADHKSGLEAVGGKMYQENATTFSGDLFIDGVDSTIDCTVRKDGIRVDFDGRTIIDWHGDLRQLSPTWSQFGAPKRNLWIGTHCNYRIKKIELVPLSNKGG